MTQTVMTVGDLAGPDSEQPPVGSVLAPDGIPDCSDLYITDIRLVRVALGWQSLRSGALYSWYAVTYQCAIYAGPWRLEAVPLDGIMPLLPTGEVNPVWQAAMAHERDAEMFGPVQVGDL